MKQTEDFIKTIQMALNTRVELFERKTVWLLMRHIEAIEEEKEMLWRQPDKSIIEQKSDLPAIPLEVAEAIIYFRSYCISNMGILEEATSPSNRHGMAIKKWADGPDGGRYDLLLKALVNGYTVDQPTEEDLLKLHIRETYEKWRELPRPENPDPQGEAAYLSELIAARVKEFYADQNN